MSNYFQCLLESQLGPDPLNQCADLAYIGGILQSRILRLEKEIQDLRTTCHNSIVAWNKLWNEDSPCPVRQALACIGGGSLRPRINALKEELSGLKIMQENILKGIDHFGPEVR